MKINKKIEISKSKQVYYKVWALKKPKNARKREL